MTFLSALGEFPEAVLGLTFGMGCALGLGFICLRVLIGFMSGGELNVAHNGINDPGHAGSLMRLGAAVGSSTAGADERSSGTGSGPHLVPAPPARDRFARTSEPDGVAAGRVVELPRFVAGRPGQNGPDNGGDAA